MRPLTIGITTRDRPRAVERCVRSLACLGPLVARVMVFDDASEEPVAEIVARAAPPRMDVSVIRDERQIGNIAGRNRLVSEAASPYVLLLDDDAIVFSADAVERAIAVLERDPNVTAIAFAQGEADGSPWPERMQAGRGREPAYVPAFIGFAHLLRREAFLRLGGYRESLVFYGEEKDFCVRALQAGQRVVYLPDAVVGHVPDPGGRSATRYVRFVIRNDCLYSLYNEPWPLVAVGLLAWITPRTRWLVAAAVLFGAGIVGFSGAIYALTFGAPRALGMVAPIGGVAFMLGWVCVAVHVMPADTG